MKDKALDTWYWFNKKRQSLEFVKDMADTPLQGSGTEGAHFWKTEWNHGDDPDLKRANKSEGQGSLTDEERRSLQSRHVFSRKRTPQRAHQGDTHWTPCAEWTLRSPHPPTKTTPVPPTCCPPRPHGRRRSTHNVQPLVHGHGHLCPQGLRQHKHVPRHRVIRPEEKNKAVQCNQRGKLTVNRTGERKGCSKCTCVCKTLQFKPTTTRAVEPSLQLLLRPLLEQKHWKKWRVCQLPTGSPTAPRSGQRSRPQPSKAKASSGHAHV